MILLPAFPAYAFSTMNASLNRSQIGTHRFRLTTTITTATLHCCNHFSIRFANHWETERLHTLTAQTAWSRINILWNLATMDDVAGGLAFLAFLAEHN